MPSAQSPNSETRTCPRHLRGHFGNRRALDISDNAVGAFVDQRFELDWAANETVNYEIAMLERMYRLAGRTLCGYKPEAPKIRISNTRKGFFEEA